MMEFFPKRKHGEEEQEDASHSGSCRQPMMPPSLDHPVSPPRKKARLEAPVNSSKSLKADTSLSAHRSPFQLTEIRDLPAELNRDTIKLKDILGNPLICECWEFNYLHDIEFLMSHFDEDIRHLVKVHVVHGFWKKEDPHRYALQEAASAYENVALHSAFLPEIFGTHHSKMIILFRRDDIAQIVIHTANMIPRDWTNMTQAAWQSPLLPLRQGVEAASGATPAFGTGAKFKTDLLNYLRVYDKQRKTCKDLISQLEKFDFSEVRGALISSAPGRYKFGPDTVTRFGWPALKDSLKRLDVQNGKADVVLQISSIATLGGTDKWLRQTFFDAMASCRNGPVAAPNFKVVFPTPDEIRRSLDGYASGGSIHTKIQSPQQLKQLQYLRPIFCHWANNCPDGRPLPENVAIREAGRRLAAPHVKTYIRYGKDGIDWAMVTSANLSKQAWGEAVNDAGEVRLASYEIGVLQWPGLYGNTAKMIPTFKKDVCEASVDGSNTALVPLRIPYDLPLQHYGPNEKPWIATATYTEPDHAGQSWVAWR